MQKNIFKADRIIVIDLNSMCDHMIEALIKLQSYGHVVFIHFNEVKDELKSLIETRAKLAKVNNYCSQFSQLSFNNDLVQVVEQYNIDYPEVFFVTRDIDVLDHALNLQMTVIFLEADMQEKVDDIYLFAADYLCSKPEGIEDIFTGEYGGHFAEAVAKRKKFSYGTYANKKLDCDDENKVTVSIAGRYFNKKTSQGSSDLLSARILANKNTGSEHTILDSVYENLIDDIDADIVLAVPPKPGKPNRFGKTITKLVSGTNIIDGSECVVCIKDYGNNKGRTQSERKEALKDAFIIPDNQKDVVKGKKFVIIDDVLTTGSTIVEIANLLYKFGASNVSAIVLGINQWQRVWKDSRYSPLICTQCGSEMVLRINKSEHTPFWGCSNYRDTNNGCKCSMDYNMGLRKLKRQNVIKAINFEDYEF